MKLNSLVTLFAMFIILTSCTKYKDPDAKLVIPPKYDYVPTEK